MSLKMTEKTFVGGFTHTALFSLVFKTSLGARLVRILLGASLFAFSVFFVCVPQSAWAEGGVQCTGFYFQAPQEGELVSPDPGPAYYLYAEFDKNVSYANNGRDDAFVQENLEKVHLRTESGKDVAGARIGGGHDQGDRQLIYVYLDEWLAPLTTYSLVIDPGIQAANGEDISTEEYVFTFKTSEMLSNGLSIYQVIVGIVIVVIIAIGVVVSAIRIRRKRR